MRVAALAAAMPWDKNAVYDLHRGFAFKVVRGGELKWMAPDGSRIISDSLAQSNNSARRSILTLADAWKDLKQINPSKAKDLGWNGLQRTLKGLKGSRKDALDIISKLVGLTPQEIEESTDRIESDERPRWGDSG